MPQTQADMAANGITIEGKVPSAPPSSNARAAVNASLTDADWKVVDGCQNADGVAEFVQAQKLYGPWTQPLQAANKSLVDQSAFKEALADLDACLKRSGLTPDPQMPWSVQGADSATLSEAQIKLAVQVVTCKQETTFTQRVADAAATLQAPIIEKYQGELVETRARIDQAVKDAKRVIADHPEALWSPSPSPSMSPSPSPASSGAAG
jgi:hypothetical protein